MSDRQSHEAFNLNEHITLGNTSQFDGTASGVAHIGNTSQIDETGSIISDNDLISHRTSNVGHINNDRNGTGQIHNGTAELDDSLASLLHTTNDTNDGAISIREESDDGTDTRNSITEETDSLQQRKGKNNGRCYRSKKIFTWKRLLLLLLIFVIIVGLVVASCLLAKYIHCTNVDKDLQENENSPTTYLSVVYNNSSWKFKGGHTNLIRYEKESATFLIYKGSIAIVHLEVQAFNEKRSKDSHIRDLCIQSLRKKMTGNSNSVCQRFSSELNIPLSVSLVAPVKKEERFRIFDDNSFGDIVKSLVIISWPDTKILGLTRFHLDKINLNRVRIKNGKLPWILTYEYGKQSIHYNSKWKLFDVDNAGVYMIFLSLNTHKTSSSNVSRMVQTFIRSRDETCRRYVFQDGISVPFDVINIEALSTRDKIDITFNNISEINNTEKNLSLNSLTIVSFQSVDFSRYILETQRPYFRLSTILGWKECKKSNLFNLLHEIVFVARETGVYWIVVSLTVQTMATEKLPEDINDIQACIEFSDGQVHCQNIIFERRVVFSIKLSTIKHLSSGQSFIITMKQTNLLYKSPEFNSMFILKL